MPRQTMPALNDRVRLERRIVGDDEHGNEREGWVVLPGANILPAKLTEYVIGGGETVQAAKLQGRALAECWLRNCQLARSILTEHRLIDLATDTELNIRHVQTPERTSRYIRLLVERGVAIG